jgi:hypothetical protein
MRAGGPTLTTANSNEICSLPTMHRNHLSVFYSHNPFQKSPLGTATLTSSTLKTKTKNVRNPYKAEFHATSRLSVRPDSDLAYARSSGRASQPQSLHHHAFEHSKFSTIMLHGLHRSTGQTTHRQKPGPDHRMSPPSSPTRASKRTKTYSP